MSAQLIQELPKNISYLFLRKKKYLIGQDVFLGYSPEREDPVDKKFSVLRGNLPKVVSGYTQNCCSLIADIYLQIVNKVYRTENIKSAEFSKLLENIYRSVNISLINELTKVSKKLKVNIYDIINAAKTKPFGFKPFYPGPGVGGHCIPVDPFFLAWKSKKLGIDLKFIKHAGDINDERPLILAKEIISLLKKNKFNKNNCNLVIFGITYKKNSDDIRETPTIKIINKLLKITKKIKICEPMLKKSSNKIFLKYNFILNNKDFYNFDKNKDFAIILTNHTKFDYNLIKDRFKLVLDTRNSFKQKFSNIIQI